LSAALLASMRAAGESVCAHKPVLTGLDELAAAGARRRSQHPSDFQLAARGPDGPVPGLAQDWPADDELLALAAGMKPREVAPLRFGAPASPKLAAAIAGVHIDADALVANARVALRGSRPRTATIAVVEGVGGLLVPFSESFTVRDFAAALALPVLIAARPGLGTINHTLLTLDAARAARLAVCAVVLTPWPRAPEEVERSNREEIERLGEVEVAVLRRVRGPDLGELERAGRWLPWRRWLGETPADVRDGASGSAGAARDGRAGGRVSDGAAAAARP
jgi:dethiobiotin synthetase